MHGLDRRKTSPRHMTASPPSASIGPNNRPGHRNRAERHERSAAISRSQHFFTAVSAPDSTFAQGENGAPSVLIHRAFRFPFVAPVNFQNRCAAREMRQNMFIRVKMR
jgi:hypothetical protein